MLRLWRVGRKIGSESTLKPLPGVVQMGSEPDISRRIITPAHVVSSWALLFLVPWAAGLLGEKASHTWCMKVGICVHLR